MVAVLGHRGASLDAPENTISAFLAARRLGADGVELDVRRTADGALVVHHDPAVAGLGRISELAAGDLPATVPLLEAALDACRGLIVNVEIKNSPAEPDHDPEERAALGVAALAAARTPADRIVVSAFSLASIDAFKAASTAIPTGWLTIASLDQVWALGLAVERGHDALHVQHHAVSGALVDQVHAAGLAVLAWTVDDADEIGRLVEAGVDTIVTNDVALAVALTRHSGD